MGGTVFDMARSRRGALEDEREGVVKVGEKILEFYGERMRFIGRSF